MENRTVFPFRVFSRQLSESAASLQQDGEAVRHMIAEVARLAEVAILLAKSGRQLDLTGLDSQVGLVCARALECKQGQGEELREALVSLRHNLENLSQSLCLPNDLI